MNALERARHAAHQRLQTLLVEGATPTLCLSKTLVIIDMQDVFVNHCTSNITSTICQLIQHAKQNEWVIILVESEEFDNTIPLVIEAVGNYPHQETVIKSGMDGGREIVECINSHPAWSLDLLICGVYGDQCVPATVRGLFDRSDLVEVSVIIDAVHPPYHPFSNKDEHGKQREKEVTTNEIGVLITEEDITR